MKSPGAASAGPCRLCGGRNLRLFYTQGNHGEFRYYRCADCTLVNYDLSGGLDQAKYAEEFPDPLDPRLPKNRAQTATYRFLRRHLAPPGRFLEIGCGNGRLLHLAKQDGWTVSGLELSPFMADSVTRHLGIPVRLADIAEPGLAEQLGPGSFDVIALRHVLEHLPDPIALMALFRTLLAPHGHVVLEFPNIEGLSFRARRALQRTGLHRKKYPPNYHPGHCNEYGRASFQHLADRTGFELLAWETYSRAPLRNWLLNRLGLGIKARTLIRMR